MREILFRAKEIEEGKWVYGSYFAHQKVSLCIITEQDEIEKNTQHLIVQDKIAGDWNFKNGIQVVDINPETLGQYTGLNDKNGTKIFEGDIVKLSSELTLDDFDGFIGQVKFELGGFNIVNGYKGDSVFQDCRDIEVIGNIYDNPELTHQHEDKGE